MYWRATRIAIVFALTANRQVDVPREQVLKIQPRFAVLCDESAAADLRQRLKAAGSKATVLAGSWVWLRLQLTPMRRWYGVTSFVPLD